MKKILCILVATIVMFTMAGCSLFARDDEYLPPAEGTTRLIVWARNPLVANYRTVLNANPNAADAKLTEKIIEDFETENPGVEVVLRDRGWAEELNEALLKAIRTNEQVDVVCGETYIKAYIEEGYFKELDSSYYDDIISDKVLPYGKNDGKLYAVPTITGSFSLLVNKQTLQDAGILDENYEPAEKWASRGIDPRAPEYWEDFLEICQDIRVYYDSQNLPNKGAICLNASQMHGPWRTLVFMRSAGGDYMDGDNFDLESPENVKAYDYLRQLYKTIPEGSLSDSQAQQFRKFYNNDIAYIIEDAQPIIEATNSNAASADQLIAVELPTFKEDGVKSNVIVGSVFYSVMNSSENAELGEKFIQHMLKEDYQFEYLKTQYRVPVLNSVLESDTIKSEEYHFSIMESFLKPFQDDTYSFESGIPSFSINSDRIWRRWVTFYDDVLKKANTITDVADYAKACDTELNGIQH